MSIRDASGAVHALRTVCGDGIFFADPCWPVVDDGAGGGHEIWCRNVVYSMTSESAGLAFCTDFVTAPGWMDVWKIADATLARTESTWPSWWMWILGPATWPKSFLFAVMYGTVATFTRIRRNLRAVRVAFAITGAVLLLGDALYDDVPAWLLFQGLVCGIGLASATTVGDTAALRRVWLVRMPVRIVTFAVACLAMGWSARLDEGLSAIAGMIGGFVLLITALA